MLIGEAGVDVGGSMGGRGIIADLCEGLPQD